MYFYIATSGASSVGSANSASINDLEISQTEILRFKEYKEQLKGHKNALKASVLDLDTSILNQDHDTPKTNTKTDLVGISTADFKRVMRCYIVLYGVTCCYTM